MGKLIKSDQLETQILPKIKNYVDNQATAQVIRTETVLFDGEASVSSANNLNQSLANFDAVRIVASAKNTADGSLWAMVEQEFGIDELTNSSPKMSATEYSNTSGTGATAAGGYTLTLLFTDTTFSITRTGNSNWTTHNPTVRKVYGIKYTVPETYSTSEQIVGTWIDSRPLYQKTITATTTSSLNTWQAFPHNISNVDSVVDFTGRRFNPNSGETYDANYYHNSGGVNVVTAGTVDRTNIYFKTSVDNSGQTLIYTLKYTKTT